MASVSVDDACFDKAWAHGEGLQVIAYSPDGKYLYSGATDSLLRAWDTEKPGEDPEKIEHFDKDITSLDCSFDAIVACSEDGTTVSFALDESGKHEMQAIITRAAPGLQARHARYGFSGRKIAVASDELLVKIIDTRDTSNIQLLSGHSKGVRAVGWNPDGSLLVTSGCDGILKVWDLTSSTEQPFCVKTIDGLIAASDPTNILACAALWHPNGKYFVIGTKSHEIAIIARDTWIRTGEFAEDGHNADICALAWSPNGNYLASAGKDDQLIVWDTLSQTPILRCKWTAGNTITALAWQPGNGANTLAISDQSGQLTQWRGVVPDGKSHPSDGPARQQQQKVKPSNNTNNNSKNEQRRAQSPSSRSEDITFSDDNRQDDAAEDAQDEDDDNGWIDDDMGGAYNDPPEQSRRQEARAPKEGLPLTKALLSSAAFAGASLGQPAFQPGATPYKEKRRYLAFNSVGIIHAVDRDHHNLVTVEFHDRSMHRGYHFEDNYKCEMAALGPRGAVYAAAARNTSPSMVNYRPFETWTAQADWQFNLPAGESVVAVGAGGIPANDIDADLAPCLGTGCIVVGTDSGYLRFFSGSGLQTHLIDLGEEIVAIAVGKEWAMVVHRRSSVVADGLSLLFQKAESLLKIRPDRQNLSYSIYDCDTFEVIQHGDIPMMKNLTLAWAGFTDDQIPAIYKSNGVLSLLNRARRPGQARWVAALDTNTLERRENKQEAYWPVTVNRTHLQCVILKGEDKHPFFPTPLLQDLVLQLPTVLAGADDQQGLLEESFLRDSLLNGHIKDGCDPADHVARQRLNAAALEIDKHLLKLMQTACKADKLEQALEAARMLNQPQSLEAAAKLAGFFHQPGLQERIQLIKEARTGESAVDRQRKDSKWGHMVDNRTVVDSAAEAQAYHSANKSSHSAMHDLSKPIDKLQGRRSLGDNSALSAKLVKPLYTRAEDSGHGSSEAEFAGPMSDEVGGVVDEDDELQQSIDAAQRARLEERQQQSNAAPLNPFAKGNAAATKPATNPFAKKKMPNSSAAHAELKRSDSFWARVDPESSAAATSKPQAVAAKQAGLFGKAPKEAAETSKKGRKRKLPADEEAAAQKAKKQKAEQPNLASFISKAKDKQQQQAAIPEQDETQATAIVESQSLPMQMDESETLVATPAPTEPVALDDLFNDAAPAIAAAA